MEDPEKAAKFDVGAFLGRHSKEIRRPELFTVAKLLHDKYDKVGAIGYCYGGWAVFELGARANPMVDCVITAHPVSLEEKDILNLGVPTQILAPENDFTFTPELKAFCNENIPKLGIDYAYEYFPGLNHSFATRGDQNKAQRDGLERAKDAARVWFARYLH